MDEMREWARPLHNKEAEYHPFEHAESVYDACMWLADRYEEMGHSVDRRSLGFASLGHDIMVNAPLNQAFAPGYIFQSYEHRSAFFSAQYLANRGYDYASVIKPTYDLIVATKNGEPCNTIEAVIIRMADIFNTQDFELFKDRAEAFYSEKCRFDNEQRTFAEWLPGAMGYLQGFLDKNLPDWFTQTALLHINKMLAEHKID